MAAKTQHSLLVFLKTLPGIAAILDEKPFNNPLRGEEKRGMGGEGKEVERINK